MRVFLFCVDALEYDFVKDRPFPHLKQKQFFKIPIPRRAMTILKDGTTIPYTPIIWKAIFTGKVEQTKPKPMRAFFPWESRALNWLKSKQIVDSVYALILERGIVKPGFPKRLGFKRKNHLAEDRETFISISKKPIIVHNPLKSDVRWGSKEFDPKETLEYTMNVFQDKRRETLLKLSKENWDLFIVYDKLLDVVGHLFWQMDRRVETYYRIVDDFAGEIQGNLSPEDVMIIVSDHGMEPLKGTKHRGGDHSRHAYASFSHKNEVPQPLKITDFYQITCDLLQQNARSILQEGLH